MDLPSERARPDRGKCGQGNEAACNALKQDAVHASSAVGNKPRMPLV
jgi:hypothetical protein